LQIADSQNATAFLSRLQDDISALDSGLSEALATALIDAGDRFPAGRDELGFLDNSLRIMWIVDELLKRFPEEFRTSMLSGMVVAAQDSLHTPAMVISYFGIDSNRAGDASNVRAGFEVAVRRLAERIEGEIASGSLFTNQRIIVRGAVLFLLFRLRDWTSAYHVKAILLEALRADVTFVNFVRSSMILGAGMLGYDYRNAAADLIGADFIATRLREILSGPGSGMLDYTERTPFAEAEKWFRSRANPESDADKVDR
jgi:hypothetical protein